MFKYKVGRLCLIKRCFLGCRRYLRRQSLTWPSGGLNWGRKVGFLGKQKGLSPIFAAPNVVAAKVSDRSVDLVTKPNYLPLPWLHSSSLHLCPALPHVPLRRFDGAAVSSGAVVVRAFPPSSRWLAAVVRVPQAAVVRTAGLADRGRLLLLSPMFLFAFFVSSEMYDSPVMRVFNVVWPAAVGVCKQRRWAAKACRRWRNGPWITVAWEYCFVNDVWVNLFLEFACSLMFCEIKQWNWIDLVDAILVRKWYLNSVKK